MSPIKQQQAFNLILAMQERYAADHSGKEGRIWAAAALLIGFLLSIGFRDYSAWSAGELFTVLIALAGSLVIATVFLRWQYGLLEHAALVTQACANVLVKYTGPKKAMNDKDVVPRCLPPRAGHQADAWFPAIVLREYGEQEKANQGNTWNERSLVMAVVTILGIVAGLNVLFAWIGKIA